MKHTLTVKQLAAISGVTVRTLHHYDEIGLLKPAAVGANGYRYYGRPELLRLQRILFHRELGAPLSRIAALLAGEGEDQVPVLLQHRARLQAEGKRLAQLIDTIDRTIASIQGERTMSNADLYRGFSEEKQAGYEEWLTHRYGSSMQERIAHGRRHHAGMNADEHAANLRTLQRLEESLSEACRRNVDVESDVIHGLIGEHRDWVARMWGRECTPAAYAGLADLYQSHPDFVARYEQLAPGFTAYLVRAMQAHAARAA